MIDLLGVDYVKVGGLFRMRERSFLDDILMMRMTTYTQGLSNKYKWAKI
jgi:hypothetical protein